MTSGILRWISVALVSLFVACGGTSEVGGSCDTSGATDECVDGAICTAEGEGAVCYELCTDQDDCGATENCNGISNSSQKSCQPK